MADDLGTQEEAGAARTYAQRFTHLVATPTRIRIRFFSSASDAARTRRPTDAVLLFLSALTLGLASLVDDQTSALASGIAAFVGALPGLVGWFWEICDALLVLLTSALVGAAVVGKGRLGLLRDQILAIGLAAVGIALLVGDDSSLAGALTASGPAPIYPAARLAIAVAAIATTAPHLGRPIRRLGRWLIPLGALAMIALAVTTPLGVVTGLAVGYGAAAFVHLVFGSPGGRPTPDDVREALGELGIETSSVQEAAVGARGVAGMEASTTDGAPLLVKVYGRDAWDGQLLTATWSYLWYRDDSPGITLSRLQQVEHEAFLTLLAERAGVPVQPVLAAGAAEEDAVLVVERRGRWLAEVDEAELTDAFVSDLWRSVARMHDAGIAHGSLDELHLAMLPEGRASIGGFAGATAAASPAQIGSDRAQLLVSTALRVGDERAVAAALGVIGADGLTEMLPFVQSAALPRATRRSLKHADTELDALRERAAAAAGTEQPKLEPLRRVTWGSLLFLAIALFLGYALISAISNVGWSALVAEFESADTGWVWAAFLVAPLVQVASAFSTIGACPRPLRLGPVIGLQFAIQFIALAVPSSAARVAMNVRFFQRTGLSTSPAIAVGLVDSVSGFIVQILLLLSIWIAGLATLEISTNGLSIDISSEVIVGVVIVFVVAIAVLVLVPRFRRMIGGKLSEAGEALRILRLPTKVLELFAGNLVAQIVLAIVLGLCLRAFGAQLSLADLIVVNTLASLFSGVMPVPGGIGVMEAAITAGLVAAGIPQTTAVSTAIMFRLVTFYLPPIWGAYASRVLRTRGYL